MAIRATLYRKTFHFAFAARTSRGAMRERVSWFLRLEDDHGRLGWGECAPLPGLSPELKSDQFETDLATLVEAVQALSLTSENLPAALEPLGELLRQRLPVLNSQSAFFFALESALLDLLNGGSRRLFNTPFCDGQPLPINGLIWMGGLDSMLQQIEIKIRDGYRCIKLKVGGLDFEKECDVLQYVRRKYFRESITIRLDANGAFKPDDARHKLRELAKFQIHSIEQPLKPGAPQLPDLCRESPIPVALDEELIGVAPDQRAELLQGIRPAYLVLKPSLHGALSGCTDWIRQAERMGIGWWVTSALESNVGLNAIAQFTSQYAISLPQGLGTGQIYTDNIPSPLYVSPDGQLSLNPQEMWDLQPITENH
jgi:o-succinylbenzoate synthase